MIIIKTPLRISFFGGGTDIPEYFNDYGCTILSTAINKHVTIVINEFTKSTFNYNHRIIYRKVEELINLKDVSHPIIKVISDNFFNNEDFNRSFDFFSFSDLPSNSGLSSSSSFTASCLQGLHFFVNNALYDKSQLAKSVIDIERKYLGEAGGYQDQIAVVYGGFNEINLDRSGFKVNNLVQNELFFDLFFKSLLLVHTGIFRNASEIESNKFTSLNAEKISKLHDVKAMALEAKKHLLNKNITDFAKMMTSSWGIKKSISPLVSNDHIDSIFNLCINNGAIGGKLLGAGGGGYLLMIFSGYESKLNVLNILTKYKIGYIDNLECDLNGTKLDII
jgi:D-glycero-alpha-D-manno-heptose-7-phosphate kinase